MRDDVAKILKALSYTQTCNLIPIIERGIEITRLEYTADQDESKREQIYDGEMMLTFLHVRKFGHQ